MDHPDTRVLARYALADITDDAELEALEDHLMECEQCRRRAVAVDLVGSTPSGGQSGLTLHIGTQADAIPVALCGVDSPHVISRELLPGLDATVVCPYCLAELRRGDSLNPQFAN